MTILTPSGGDDTAAIIAADQSAGQGEAVHLADGPFRVSQTLTLASPVRFEPGAALKPEAGATVTLAAPYYAKHRQHVFDISTGGSIAMKRGSMASAITPDHFGANPDAEDNSDAFHAAFGSVKPDWSVLITWDGRTLAGNYAAPILIPEGRYRIKRGDIPLHSLTTIRGVSRTSSAIHLTEDASGESILTMAGGIHAPHLCGLFTVESMLFESDKHDAWCLYQSKEFADMGGFSVNWVVRDCVFAAANGIKFNRKYSQQFLIENCYQQGKAQSFVQVSGNRGIIRDCDCEGGILPGHDPATDGTADPYIMIGTEDGTVDSGNIVVENLLLEGVVYTNKPAIRIANSHKSRLRNIHLESDYDIYISLHNAPETHIDHFNFVTAKDQMWQIGEGSSLHVGRMGSNGGIGTDWTNGLHLHPSSHVEIDRLILSHSCALPADRNNIVVHHLERRHLVDETLPSKRNVNLAHHRPASNIITNPHFAMGDFGWHFQQGPAAPARSFVPSKQVPGGHALRLVWESEVAGSWAMSQRVAIPKHLVGQPIAMCAVVEIAPLPGEEDLNTWIELIPDGASRAQLHGLQVLTGIYQPTTTKSPMGVGLRFQLMRPGWEYTIHYVGVDIGQDHIASPSGVHGSIHLLDKNATAGVDLYCRDGELWVATPAGHKKVVLQ